MQSESVCSLFKIVMSSWSPEASVIPHVHQRTLNHQHKLLVFSSVSFRSWLEIVESKRKMNWADGKRRNSFLSVCFYVCVFVCVHMLAYTLTATGIYIQYVLVLFLDTIVNENSSLIFQGKIKVNNNHYHHHHKNSTVCTCVYIVVVQLTRFIKYKSYLTPTATQTSF